MPGYSLAEFAQVEEDNPIRRGIFDGFRRDSKLADMFRFSTIDALHVDSTRIATVPSPTFRELGSGFLTGVATLRKERWGVSDLGVDVRIDRRFTQATNTLESPKTTNTRAARKGMTYAFNNYLINGNPAVNPLEFPGLVYMSTTLPAEQTIDAGSLDLNDPTARGTNGKGLLFLMRKAFRLVEGGPTLIIANETFIDVFNAVLIEQNEGALLAHDKDNYDRWITSWRGVPLIDPGRLSDQLTFVLPDSLDGTNLSSVFFVRLGEEYITGIQEKPLEVSDWYRLPDRSNMVEQMTIAWALGLANSNDRSMVRVKNLLIGGAV